MLKGQCQRQFKPICKDEIPLNAEYKNIEDLVEAFKEHCVPKILAEQKFYKNQPSPGEAIRVACAKGHSHQRRIPKSSLRIAKKRLLRKELQLSTCSSFNQLYEAVNTEIRSIYKIGDLTVYDIAHRIGLHLGANLKPKDVYLHRGTREGAKILGLVERGQKKINGSDLKDPLKGLEPQIVEDFLCI